MLSLSKHEARNNVAAIAFTALWNGGHRACKFTHMEPAETIRIAAIPMMIIGREFHHESPDDV
ncbi:hypothetical protein OSJ77_05740 [Phyllobacterium sp. 0TCS1.6C]|uniref:hypothetical protein n=1 Tax=unclassified Phyllobacterium TaxID=2638441 RepID=UPI002264146F|nr:MULTISPECIES: hypothetical protein [unclassified Phyllobacterium]MCX8279681.1 hypothetical protein [Phyllobacterium sp. 0TCS1.6C]MCX8292128.1 hypothetical protein [Phyllobacterium sp. 0TCS1.6A]